jgi:tripartite-type tricarboxylate transporter receptor subunit TctC
MGQAGDRLIRRRALLAALGAGASGSVRPQVPEQPLPLARLLLGAPPGGVGDLMARRLADKLRGRYARSVVVENRPGAGGQLAAVAMKQGPDDGSLLLLTPSSLLTLYPHTYRQLPYRPDTDLAPAALVAWSAMAFAAGPAVPGTVRDFNDFLAWARAHPRAASYGSPASGSMPHLLVASLAHARGVGLTHIAYRGSTPALQDLRGGTLPAHAGPVGVFLPHLKSGHVRLLAVSGIRRSAFVPEVRTWREQGHAVDAREWYGFFLPGRSKPGIVQHAAAVLRAAMLQPDMSEALAAFGLEPAAAAANGPAELAGQMRADLEEWREPVRRIGFSAES